MKRFILFVLLCTSTLSALAERRVINAGFPGFSTKELDAQMDAALQRKPEYVVIFAGANDALNDAKFVAPADTKKYLEDMVERAQAAGATVLLVTAHDPDIVRLMKRHKPEAYGDRPPLARLAEVDQIITQVARDRHVRLVPFHEILQKAGGANDELSTDGVHLTAEGYAMLAKSVRAEMPHKLPKDLTVLCFGDSLTYGTGVRQQGGEVETAETYPSQLRKLLK